MLIEAWQLQRGELNHRWLTNQFLVSYVRGSLLAILASPDPDADVLEEFAARDWPSWAKRRRELESLLDSAEDALSPRQLLEHTTLVGESREVMPWLTGVVHAAWLARTAVRDRIANAKDALADVDQRYCALTPLLDPPDEVDVSRLKRELESFREFEAAVLRLTECIHRLPRHVEVV